MTDQELLQAIGQVVETVVDTKLEPIRQDIHELKGSVQSLETGLGRLELRMDQLEANMCRVETRMDRVEFNMDRLGSGIKQLELETGKLGIRADKLETKVDGIRAYMDTEQKRTLDLLLEGQQALWDRFVPQEKFEALEDRTQILELMVKRHSQEIRRLQFA